MAAPARKKFKVTLGNSHISVYPYGKTKWRFGWRENRQAKWDYITRPTKDDIIKEANRILEQLDAGGIVWTELSRDELDFFEVLHRKTTAADWPAILAFVESRKQSSEIVAAVARFMDFKVEEAGEETPHLTRTRAVLEDFATSFASQQVAEIHSPEIVDWWKDRCKIGTPAMVSPKRRKDIRAALVMFWKWAQVQGIAGADPIPAAQRIPNTAVVKTDKEITIIEPPVFLKLVEAIEPQYRGWLVAQYFAGLRPEEAAPPNKEGSKKKHKRGLRKEEIDFRFKVIHLPAVVSKGGKRPRKIPLSETALIWFEWAGLGPDGKGPICALNAAEEEETLRLGKLLFSGEWPKDALRHSFGSYRNAKIRNFEQLAGEMGNSVKMVHDHYHNPRTDEEGDAWLALRPPGWVPKEVRFDPISADTHPHKSSTSAP